MTGTGTPGLGIIAGTPLGQALVTRLTADDRPVRSCGPVLRVVATWTDRQGQPHHTSFSVQCNGLEGALDRAIAARISCGER